jgi:hypothetical protein
MPDSGPRQPPQSPIGEQLWNALFDSTFETAANNVALKELNLALVTALHQVAALSSQAVRELAAMVPPYRGVEVQGLLHRFDHDVQAALARPQAVAAGPRLPLLSTLNSGLSTLPIPEP